MKIIRTFLFSILLISSFGAFAKNEHSPSAQLVHEFLTDMVRINKVTENRALLIEEKLEVAKMWSKQYISPKYLELMGIEGPYWLNTYSIGKFKILEATPKQVTAKVFYAKYPEDFKVLHFVISKENGKLYFQPIKDDERDISYNNIHIITPWMWTDM